MCMCACVPVHAGVVSAVSWKQPFHTLHSVTPRSVKNHITVCINPSHIFDDSAIHTIVVTF